MSKKDFQKMLLMLFFNYRLGKDVILDFRVGFGIFEEEKGDVMLR